MLLLPEGQTGEAWEPSKNKAVDAVDFHSVFEGLL
jgi:hypothetical protein